MPPVVARNAVVTSCRSYSTTTGFICAFHSCLRCYRYTLFFAVRPIVPLIQYLPLRRGKFLGTSLVRPYAGC